MTLLTSFNTVLAPPVVADGVTVRFDTGRVLTSPQDIIAVVGGTFQFPNAYTVSGTEVVYNEPPPAGLTVEHWIITGSGTTGSGTVESLVMTVSDELTPLTTGTAKVTFRMPMSFTLTGVRASLSTASSSGAVTVNIKEGGVSLFGANKLTIAQGSKTSVGGIAPTLSDTALADDAEITVDIDSAGTGAKGLKIALIGVPGTSAPATSGTTPTDPLWSSVTFLVQPKAGATSYATDAKGTALTYVGNAAVDGGVGVFAGGGSILFDGDGDMVTFPKEVLLALNGVSNYTIELLVYLDPAGSLAWKDFIGLDQSGRTDAVSLKCLGTGQLSMSDWSSNNGSYTAFTDAATAPTGSLLYIAYVKNVSGGTATGTLYKNAVSVATGPLVNSTWTDLGVPGALFGRPGVASISPKGRLYAARITHAARSIVMPTGLWPETGP